MDEVRRVSTIFTIDDSEHNRKLKQMNDQYKLTQSEIKLAGTRMTAFGKNSSDSAFKQAALTKQIETLNNKTKLYKESLEKVTTKATENSKKLVEMKKRKEDLTLAYKNALRTYGETSNKTEDLKKEMEKANKEYLEQERVVKKNVDTANNYKTTLNNVESELVQLQAELNKANNKFLQASEKLQRAGEKMQNVGRGMQTVGGNLTRYVTAPLIGLGVLAAKEAIGFESAFAGVEKTVDGTTKQMENLKKGIIDMSKEIPSTTTEISAVAAAAGQLGIETDSILEFTKVIIDLGNSTNLVGEEGASQLAKFANITQMSQKDFGKLGSVIVDLGNNMATTEADIVNMAMRLAGAGKQVGMSESDIMSFSAALSSVGIEAEAGGSAFSKVMLNIQTAIQTGDKSVKGFAKVAGMSAKDFAKAYETDATGALIAFVEGLGKLDNKAVVLDELGLSELRVRDALLRASSAGDLFSKSIDIGSKAWSENTALTEEANKRYATTESQLKILKNELADAARELGVELLPYVKDGIILFKDLIKGFKNLDPEMKKNLVKWGMIAIALGPVLSVAGKVTSGIGGILKIGSKAAGLLAGLGSKATIAGSAASTAAGSAGGVAGFAGMASSLGAVAVAAAPYILAAGAIAGAGYLIYKGMTKEVIPSVDLFEDKMVTSSDGMDKFAGTFKTTVTKISDSTKTAVGAYVTLDDEATKEMNNLYVNSTVITDDIVTDMTTKFDGMSKSIIEGYEKQKTESLASLSDFFAKSSALTEAEEAAAIEKTASGYEERKVAAEGYTKEISDIYAFAASNNRAITAVEQAAINEIQMKMKTVAVNTLSENEIEANIILERMKGYSTRITAEQSAEVITQLNTSKDEAIRIANEEYTGRIDAIVRARDEAHSISAEQANLLITEATRQRDETIKKADETRIGAIEKMRGLNADLDTQVDTSTGKILTTWDKLKRWWSGWKPESKGFTANVSTVNRSSTVGKGATVAKRSAYALGTSNAVGGLTALNEKGYEVVDLPAGSKVKNHLGSTEMVKDVANATARAVAGEMIGGLKDILSNIGGGEHSVSGNINVNMRGTGSEYLKDKTFLNEVEKGILNSIEKGNRSTPNRVSIMPFG